MKSTRQVGLGTAEKWKQYVRDEQSRINIFNDKVRLAKQLLAAAGESDLEHLVVEERPAWEDYEVPPVDALSAIGPGRTVYVGISDKHCEEDVCFLDLFITDHSGAELCGSVNLSYGFEQRERITFELEHVCFVEDDGADET